MSHPHQPQDLPSPDFEISVQELKQRMDRKDSFHLIDVREPEEYAVARIEGSTLIPLGEIPHRHRELDKNEDIVLLCKSGFRSLNALEFLRSQGFQKLKSVGGGITAWSKQIDPSVPRY